MHPCCFSAAPLALCLNLVLSLWDSVGCDSRILQPTHDKQWLKVGRKSDSYLRSAGSCQLLVTKLPGLQLSWSRLQPQAAPSAMWEAGLSISPSYGTAATLKWHCQLQHADQTLCFVFWLIWFGLVYLIAILNSSETDSFRIITVWGNRSWKREWLASVLQLAGGEIRILIQIFLQSVGSCYSYSIDFCNRGWSPRMVNTG